MHGVSREMSRGDGEKEARIEIYGMVTVVYQTAQQLWVPRWGSLRLAPITHSRYGRGIPHCGLRPRARSRKSDMFACEKGV